MKKLLLLSVIIGFAVVANAGAAIDCASGKISYGYQYGIFCKGCPTDKPFYTKDGRCVPECSAKQYVNPSTMKCASCPANATCDGVDAKCKAGYVHDSSYKGAYKCVAQPGIYGCKGVVSGYKTTAEACSCSSGLHDGKKCIACVNDKKGNAVDSGCKANAPLCNGAEGKVGTACMSISCAKNQYLDIFQNAGNGGTCKKCPANATCDGRNATCKAGYENVGRSEVKCVVKVCAKNEYIDIYQNSGNGGTCKKCPANATCDGKNAKCNAGYENIGKSEVKCVAKTCAKNQHLENGVCKECPKNATCNGKDFNCKSYLYSVAHHACDVPHCSKAEYWNIANCEKCPANATCDGEKVTRCKAGYELKNNKCVAKSCAKDQHFENGVCKACPKNATCDGKDFSCKSYTYSAAHHACDVPHCSKTEYWNIANCEKCPANTVCDGEKVIGCKAGYKLSGSKCVAITPCSKNQYLRFDKKQNKEICEACPKGATCDGRNPKCPNGYTKDAESRVICNVKMCRQGSHESHDWIKKRYKNCTKCTVENVKAGACAKNKKAHKHYYCQCDC